MTNTTSETYTPFQVWDAPTRWFHWINALAVFGLILMGLGLLYDDALGLSASGRFCCKSRLREAAKRDSVVVTRFSVRSIHDGPSEE